MRRRAWSNPTPCECRAVKQLSVRLTCSRERLRGQKPPPMLSHPGAGGSLPGADCMLACSRMLRTSHHVSANKQKEEQRVRLEPLLHTQRTTASRETCAEVAFSLSAGGSCTDADAAGSPDRNLSCLSCPVWYTNPFRYMMLYRSLASTATHIIPQPCQTRTMACPRYTAVRPRAAPRALLLAIACICAAVLINQVTRWDTEQHRLHLTRARSSGTSSACHRGLVYC